MGVAHHMASAFVKLGILYSLIIRTLLYPVNKVPNKCHAQGRSREREISKTLYINQKDKDKHIFLFG